jgi:hypothetical protein
METGVHARWLALALIELAAGLVYVAVVTVLLVRKRRAAERDSGGRTPAAMSVLDVIRGYAVGGMALFAGGDDLLLALDTNDSVPACLQFALQGGALVCALLATWHFVTLFSVRAPEVGASEK